MITVALGIAVLILIAALLGRRRPTAKVCTLCGDRLPGCHLVSHWDANHAGDRSRR